MCHGSEGVNTLISSFLDPSRPSQHLLAQTAPREHISHRSTFSLPPSIATRPASTPYSAGKWRSTG
ncbi:hypothetical protein E2C01_066672 [Portunus trituberculatus]|uniref:Uncharacterized protein n=1 Tax=Portunus trituberculatus TaxID=210409 RepID=A0A5B7HUG5_PORTR|nr:hypothetical protein [Portunus trituberculatus]